MFLRLLQLVAVAALARARLVPFSDIDTCPSLPAKPAPTHVSDVRPDDISVVMALGDSITAGFLARSSPDDPSHIEQGSRSDQLPLSPGGLGLPVAREYRGLAYPIGGDEDAVTIPNILGHWSKNLTGMSTGHHPLLEASGEQRWREERDDGLNAAISGSKSADLIKQVQGFLLPKIKEMQIDKNTWKLVNIGIGGNDLCAYCLSSNDAHLRTAGSAQEYARSVKHAVDVLRSHVPNVIVNIVGLFSISSLYERTLNNPYCKGPFLPPLPRLPVECSCALLPGPAGDYTRRRMDELADAYNDAMVQVIQDWQEEESKTFGVIWQPASMIRLEDWPIEAFSPIDCFHPSELAHQQLAAGIWNRLTLNVTERGKPLKWDKMVRVKCLEEKDRIVLWA